MDTEVQKDAKDDDDQHVTRPRRVDQELDMLHEFETGNFHDCTIRVGCNLQDSKSTYKDFPCHKVVLSGCSTFFKTMFQSSFKEATMGVDDPIPLDNTDPEVFECVMR
jgi:hypothetical protein